MISTRAFWGAIDSVRIAIASFRSIIGACLTVLPYLFGFGSRRKVVTEQYPDPVSSRSEDDLPPRTRGLLFNEIEKCTGCKQCEVICPSECISVKTDEAKSSGKMWVSVFDIDLGRCMFCGLCVEVCEPRSLVHTKKFELASYSRDEMKVRFGRGEDHDLENRQKWETI